MRGEKQHNSFRCFALQGSSPHARGKDKLELPVFVGTRIIPACAGKSQCNSASHPMMKDHPRMRGEKCKGAHNESTKLGSSPHARGKETVMSL